jgi:hypothetical protein
MRDSSAVLPPSAGIGGARFIEVLHLGLLAFTLDFLQN